MKPIIALLSFFISINCFAQDILMQDGTFNQCSGSFLDSGGPGNYSNNEDFEVTICSPTAGEAIVLNFMSFLTQNGVDEMTIYDGDDINAPIIGTYSGGTSPGTILTTTGNASGCLTITFVSNGNARQSGWEASIECVVPCQEIIASIDSTNPAAVVGEIDVLPGDIITFNGSGTFSNDDSSGTYTWDFGDGSTAEAGLSVTHSYGVSGSYTVTFTVDDDNTLECADTQIIVVNVLTPDVCIAAQPMCSDIVNVPSPVGNGSAESGIDYDCLSSQPNPIWYFLQTGDVGGDLDFQLTQYSGQDQTGTGNDIDFIIWGPFTEPQCGSANLNSSTQVDCSYSISANEQILVTNASPNSYYMLLITNYDNEAGYINMVPNPGSIDTNCDIICQVDLGEDQAICSDSSYTITPSFNGSFNTFEWQLNGVTIPGETGSSIVATQSGTYTLLADGTDAVFGDPCNTQDDIVISFQADDSVDVTAANSSICLGEDAIFTITGTSGDVVDYNLNAGATQQVTIDATGEAVVTVTPATADQTITLESVTNPTTSCSSTLTDTATITVNTNPTINILSTNTDICSGTDAIFTITGTSGDVIDYTINGSATQQVTVDATGEAVVTVTAATVDQTITLESITNPTTTCSSSLTDTATVVIITDPTITALTTNTDICEGADAIFTITGTSGDIINYTINTGATQQVTVDATGEAVVTITAATADQTITLESVTNPTTTCSASLSDTETITVNPNPTVALTTNTDICEGADAIFTITGTSGDVVDYNLNAGATQQVTIDATGEAVVTVTAAAADQTITLESVTNPTTSCSSTLTDTATITVNANPTINILSTNTDICSSTDAIFTITGTSGDVIDYTINGGATQQVTVDTTGEAVVTVTAATVDQTITLESVTNPTTTCSSSLTDTATIVIIADPTITALTTNTDICEGADAIFTITGTSGDIINYNINAGATEQVTLDATGEAIVTITATTADQTITLESVTNPTTTCSASLSDTATVTVNPNPTVVLTTNTDICSGDDAIFTITGTSGDIVDYNLNAGATQQVTIDVTTGEALVTVTAATADQTITLESVTNPTTTCSSTLTDTATITVNANPTINILSTNSDICEGADAIFTITGTAGDVIDYTINAGTTQQVTVDATDEAVVTVTAAAVDQTITLESVTNPTTNCSSALTDTATVTVISNPTVTQTSNSSICEGEDAIFTITGTTADIVDYNINGEATQQVIIGLTGEETITIVAPTVDQTLELESVNNPSTTCTSMLTTTETVVVNPLPTVVTPTILAVCDDSMPDGFTDIDLTIKNQEISGANPDYSVTYYLTQADADAQINPLPNPYTNISNPQIIIAGVLDINTSCYDTTTLELEVQQAPAAFTPNPLEYCDPDSDGFGEFMLTDADAEVTGGDPDLVVTYHETMTNAQNNVNMLSSPYPNIAPDMQTLYVRVESSTISTNCASFVELILIVHPTPAITDPTPLEVCDDNADGIATFDLTTKDLEILNHLDTDTTNDLDPTQYTVSYYATPANAEAGINAIPTPNAYDSTTETIDVRVEDTANGCYSLTTLDLIVNALPVLTQPDPLELCDVNNPGDQVEEFTLEDANAQILGTQTGINLTYYNTLAGAETGDMAAQIFSPHANNGVNPAAQTIFVRAENEITGCVSTITLDLRVNPIPSPVAMPMEYTECDDDIDDGFVSFDLESQSAAIANGEPNISITYYETQTDAMSMTNALTSPYVNTTAYMQTVYVVAENNNTGCFTIVELPLVVLPAPVVPLNIEDYVVCDDDPDGLSEFDFDAVITPQIFTGGQTAADYTLTYHVSQADADSGNNPIVNTSNYPNNGDDPQTIYIRLISNDNDCVTTGEFIIRVSLPPVLNSGYDNELSQCDDLDADYMSANDGVTSFDLTVEDIEITGASNTSWVVTYYETEADAQADTNAIADPTDYTGGPAETLHVRFTDNNTGCFGLTTVTIRVLNNPTPTPEPMDLEACDYVDIVGPNDELETFDLTQNENTLFDGETGVSASYYLTQDDALMGVNAIADPTMHVNEDPANPGVAITPQTIYVRVTNGDDPAGTNGTGCYSLVTFDVIVNPLPVVTAVDDLVNCEFDPADTSSFDLESMTPAILNGQDPTVFMVTYHETLAEAQAEMNALSSPYPNSSDPQPIYFNITNTVTGCYIATAAQTFNLIVDELAQANPDMDPYEECEDTMGSAVGTFDLDSLNPDVLDGQDPDDYTVSYYTTQADADAQINPLVSPYSSSSQIIVVRVDNDTMEVRPFILDLSILTEPLDVDGNGMMDTIDLDDDGFFDIIDVNEDDIPDGFDSTGDGNIDYIDLDGDGNGDLVDLNNDGEIDNGRDLSSCYDTAEITLQVNPKPAFNLDSDYLLCINTNGTEIINPPVIETGLNTIDYTFEWSYEGVVLPGETGSSITPTQGGLYSVTVTDVTTSTETMCEETQSTTVIVSEPPVVTAEVITLAFAAEHAIEVTASPSDPANNSIAVYEFSIDGGSWEEGTLNNGIYSHTFTDVGGGDHTITVRDTVGCGETTITKMVMDYPLYFTPNGDGFNDTWNIYAIANQPDAVIYIFDRFGKLLKQLSPTGAGWNGTYNGNLLPTDDYWFTVEYREPNNLEQKKIFKAHFTLKR